jgi:hypothetical protein
MKKYSVGPDKVNTCEGLIFLFLSILSLIQMDRAFATASTQIWNPSADIQKQGTIHFGIDNYFSIIQNDSKPSQIDPDLGATVGVYKPLEVGIDMVQPSTDPFFFNFKFGLPESDLIPALAVGGFNFGTKAGVTDYNILYGIMDKTIPQVGRLSLGYYRGMNADLFPDGSGKESKDGVIATWDKTLTNKIWTCVDYASGKSWYGSISFGVSYAFSSSASVIFGYVIFNDHDVVPNDLFTTQLDINLF